MLQPGGIVFRIVVTLCVAAVVILLHRLIRPTSPEEGGQKVLQYNFGLKVLALLFWGVAAVLLYAVIQPTQFSVLLRVAILLFFLLFVVLFSLEVFLVQIRYDDRRITCYSPWRASRTIDWEEIQRLKYSMHLHGFVSRTTSNGTLRLVIGLDGLIEFLAAAKGKEVVMDELAECYLRRHSK